MPFDLRWTSQAQRPYNTLRAIAEAARAGREVKGRAKSSKAEGLFRQVVKAVSLLRENPKHPGLNTHEYGSLAHPYDPEAKVWEAYLQNNTPGAYRLFWCYGPEKGQIMIIAITPHP